MNILEVKNLSKNYPDFHVEGINLSLGQGEIMGFIGKNGAGKSTTIKSILNMVTPDSGEVNIFSLNVKDHELEIKRRLGVVLGGVDFYQQKKTKQIAKVMSRFYDSWDDQAFHRYLEEFEIDGNKRPKELSAGMKVKFMIALALSHKAELLIFDEPTSGLDPVSRDDLLNLFRQIVKTGERSILFSTHITSDIEKCADSIAYIKDGKLLRNDSKENFMDSFDYLRKPEDNEPLTLEEIMIRIEGEKHYDI